MTNCLVCGKPAVEECECGKCVAYCEKHFPVSEEYLVCSGMKTVREEYKDKYVVIKGVK